MPIFTQSALNMQLPRMIKVRQKFDDREIVDIEAAVKDEIFKEGIRSRVKIGQRVAVAVGSRGIRNLNLIVKAVIDCLKELGAEPFIVPSMGSHGGATAEGQTEILSTYGVTEEAMRVPIVSSMEVVEIGRTLDGIEVYMDKSAYNADMVVLIGRVKPHTDFKGSIESGLCKMMAIGLGKHEGCSRIHREGLQRFHEVIPKVAEVFIKNANIGFGVAIVENAYDKTALIRAVAAESIMEEEPKLLEVAKESMASIMIPYIDVLIVERIGKDITGAGMDPNITGRGSYGVPPGFKGPKIKRIIALDLTEGAHGSAIGMGLADFSLKSIFNKIDYTATYANAIAARTLEVAKIPILLENEREAVIAAVKSCIGIDENDPKIVRIKDTLHLEYIYVSENLIPYVETNNRLEVMEKI